MASLQKRHLMLLLFIFGLSICFFPNKLRASLVWESDYKTALEKSRSESKPLLLYFTGSDWSGWSMKMKNEILDSQSFQALVSPLFVCVEIDFPQHKGFSVEKQEQNLQLKTRFHVEDYPSLILVDVNEREILHIGYVPESGLQLAQDLVRVIEQDTQLTLGLSKLEDDPIQLRKLYQLAC